MGKGRNDYVTTMLDYAVDFSALLLKNFDYYLFLMGTDVTVSRVVEGEFREALGAAYIFDGTDIRNKTEIYNKRIIINRSQLVNAFKSTTNDLEAFTNENFYKIGDQLSFISRNTNYKYKVTEIEQFDPYNDILFKLTLAGFEEYKN